MHTVLGIHIWCASFLPFSSIGTQVYPRSYYYLVSNYFNPTALLTGVWYAHHLLSAARAAICSDLLTFLPRQVDQSKCPIVDGQSRDRASDRVDRLLNQLLSLNMVGVPLYGHRFRAPRQMEIDGH